MHILFYILFLFIGLFSTEFLYSQNDNLKFTQLIDITLKNLKNNKKNKVVKKIEKILKKDTTNSEAIYLLGKFYFEKDLLDNTTFSLPYLLKTIENDPLNHIELYYDISSIYFYNLKNYLLSLNYMEMYLFNIKNKEGKFQVRNIENALKIRDISKIRINMPIISDSLSIENLGISINSYFNEYLPFLSSDLKRIYFTRLDTIHNKGTKLNYKEVLYTSKYTSEGWEERKILDFPFNSNHKESGLTITSDGNTIFFSICDKKDGFGNCDIYFTTKEEKGWTEPINIGEPINTAFDEIQPYFSPNGMEIYFASNRTDGNGGYDIWVSSKNKFNQWDLPKNLGKQINSKADEMAPFLHPDLKTFYFTSNNEKSIGKKDIFFSKKTQNSFQIPKNLGYPINNESEQYNIYVSYDGKYGYTASKYNSKYGKEDLISFIIPKNLRPESCFIFKGKITDSINKKGIKSEIILTNKDDNNFIYKYLTSENSGEFYFLINENYKYNLTVLTEFYEDYKVEIDNKSIDFKEVHNITLNKITYKKTSVKTNEISSQEISENILKSLAENFITENEIIKNNLEDKKNAENERQEKIEEKLTIFYFENESIINEYFKPMLTEFADILKNNSNKIIYLNGYQDKSENNNICVERNMILKTYLINLGININQIIVKEMFNNIPFSTENTKLGKSLNRRVELIIEEKNKNN